MSVRVGISTQTPLLRLSPRAPPSSNGETTAAAEAGLAISPGGVTRLVLGNLRRWFESGWLERAHWLSLQPNAPSRMEFPDLPLTLHHIEMPADELAAYARTKEHLWAEIHGTPSPVFDLEDFRSFARYNWLSCKNLLEHLADLDVIYVHDFQLTQVGAIVGLAAPTVIRWHVPFDAQRIQPYVRNFLVRALEGFDAVIVSTRRDLEGLLRSGFHGNARQIYPTIDGRDWPEPSPDQVAEFERLCGASPDTPLIVCVARMDPIKRQDLLIEAMGWLRTSHPSAKLVLIGNGSFSSAKAGGLGLSKAEHWSARLQEQVRQLELEDRVVFAHWLPDSLLSAAYRRSTVVTLCSDIEGFGLTVLEAWRYGRATVVTEGCGVSEVMEHGVNGLVVPSGNVVRLAEALGEVLSSPERRDALGASARLSVMNHDSSIHAGKVSKVLQEAIEHFEAQGGRGLGSRLRGHPA